MVQQPFLQIKTVCQASCPTNGHPLTDIFLHSFHRTSPCPLPSKRKTASNRVQALSFRCLLTLPELYFRVAKLLHRLPDSFNHNFRCLMRIYPRKEYDEFISAQSRSQISFINAELQPFAEFLNHASPVSWPHLSFIPLNLSISRSSTAKFLFFSL